MSDRTPALRKIQTAFMELVASVRPDLRGFADRSDAEPLTDSERPGYIIRIPRFTFDIAPENNQTYCRATISLDLQSGGEAGETIDEVNQRSIADIIAALGNDRTLGGRLQEMQESAASGSELDGADVGTAILDIDISFFTPRGDFYTIVGHGGVHF